jgi:transcriptional regulator with PAS, ATPase and Fis domain
MRIHENPAELDELIAKVTEKITGQRSTELTKTVVSVIDNNLGRDYHWPGNVRELEQCIRRVIIKQDYEGDKLHRSSAGGETLAIDTHNGSMTTTEVVRQYCKLLYERYGTYSKVAQKTGLDNRTVKKHIMK